MSIAGRSDGHVSTAMLSALADALAVPHRAARKAVSEVVERADLWLPRLDELPFDVARLRKYLSERAKIEPRRKTATCARHQRALTVALKRARHMALLPYVGPHSR